MSFSQSHVIVLCNQKGGCGKTTSAVNTSAALAEAGHRVCMIDMDPQCNLTNNFMDKLGAAARKDGGNTERFTIFDVMLGHREAGDAVIHFSDSYGGNLSMIPGVKNLSSISLIFDNTVQATISSENHSDIDADEIRVAQRQVLKNAVRSIDGRFDFIIIDTPPDLNFLLTVSLVAADWAIIPVQPSEYDVEGLAALAETIVKIKKRHNPRLDFLGVLLCRYAYHINIDKDFLSALTDQFGDGLMLPPVGNYKDCREATTDHVTVLEHNPRCDASDAYRRVATSILKIVSEHENDKTGTMRLVKTNS